MKQQLAAWVFVAPALAVIGLFFVRAGRRRARR